MLRKEAHIAFLVPRAAAGRTTTEVNAAELVTMVVRLSPVAYGRRHTVFEHVAKGLGLKWSTSAVSRPHQRSRMSST